MAVEEIEPEDIERKVHDLAKAMEKSRAAHADRDDVVIDMKHAKISRLELLAGDLKPVFEGIPKDCEQFEFAITNGLTPRLWIDMTSFVRMAADGREYEFVKDTRLGRTVLGRSENRDLLGEAITAYVAERLVERERMIEGDWIAAREGHSGLEQERRSETAETDQEAASQEVDLVSPASRKEGFPAWLVFLFGVAAGLGGLWLAVISGEFQTLLEWWRGSLG